MNTERLLTESYIVPRLDGARFLSGIEAGAAYEVDATEIWYRPAKFVLVTASGCSCWDGDYETEEFDSLDALGASLLGTERTYGNPSASNSERIIEEARRAAQS